MRKSRDIHQLPLFETLNQSPTNNSKSKTTFSYSKTPRFPLTKATSAWIKADVPSAPMLEHPSNAKTQARLWGTAPNTISPRHWIILLRADYIVSLVPSKSTRKKEGDTPSPIVEK